MTVHNFDSSQSPAEKRYLFQDEESFNTMAEETDEETLSGYGEHDIIIDDETSTKEVLKSMACS